MKGETTIEERINEFNNKIDHLMDFFGRYYNFTDSKNRGDYEYYKDFIATMIYDLCYFAIQEGIDIDHEFRKTLEIVENHFPDPVPY